MRAERPCRVVLLGMMGSGKTTLGRELSRRTGWLYRDNDELLMEATGRTARDLADDGPEELRRAEAAALQAALRTPEPALVAAAGGVVLDGRLRDLLRREGLVVWLRARARTLAERAGRGSHRPWLDADATAWIARTAAEREPLYREVAALELDTESALPQRLAGMVLERLAETPCARWLGTPLADTGMA